MSAQVRNIEWRTPDWSRVDFPHRIKHTHNRAATTALSCASYSAKLASAYTMKSEYIDVHTTMPQDYLKRTRRNAAQCNTKTSVICPAPVDAEADGALSNGAVPNARVLSVYNRNRSI